ncbi:hypothetical protein [Pseudomonas putida]|uniref:Uncharacterized protein n=1 Tax=Pseudomonas putida TaxID=303 RepID=A0A8I1EH80_PSEPU|nr:hypothetical protein [Pseudomonas putida]MBI6885169.1 hypothetical protein [Pseudomonas putida]
MNIDSVVAECLEEFAGKNLIDVLGGDELGKFTLLLGSKGVSAFANFDYFTEKYKNHRKSIDDAYRDSFARNDVERKFLRGLHELSESKDTMDDAFAYSMCSRGMTLAKYIDGANYDSILRDSNGNFRRRELFSSLGVNSLKKLMESSIYFLDPEGLEFLRGLDKGRAVLTDEFIFEHLRKSLQRGNNTGNLEKYFGKYLLSENQYKKTLSSYWKYLEDRNVFHSNTPENVLHDAYDIDVIKRHPDAFVEKLLNIGRQETYKANIFMLKLIDDGIDCYTGFILGHHGMFVEFDSRGLPRDYISMIDVCLKNKPLPGYKALLSSIPLDEVQSHPRSSEVLNIIHEMTGRHDVIKVMNNKNKGRAILNDLGV